MEKKKPKAIVIGAGGHLGNAITRALLSAGWSVTGCGRRTTTPLNLRDLPVTYLSGDAGATGQLDRWFAGHDLVVDGAAPYPMEVVFPGLEPKQDPFATAEIRTSRMIDAVLRHGAVLAYVGSFISLVAPRTEAQRLRAQIIRLTLPYFEVKELIESRLLDACRSGLRAVLLNPTYCLGPWDLHDRRVCTIPLLLSGEIPGWITQMLNIVDVRDAAAAIIRAVGSERYGEPLLITGHTISTHDFYSLVCQMGGVRAPRIASSATLAMVGSYLVELAYSMLGEQTPIISAGMMMATAVDYLQPGPALNELGITPRPLTDTIRDAIEWYRSIGYC
jgi:nucleoside-diphosphate-sugar epimerase